MLILIYQMNILVFIVKTCKNENCTISATYNLPNESIPIYIVQNIKKIT